MSDPKAIEQHIRETIATHNSSVALADKHFSPGGLFNQLGATPEDRKALVQSPLFQQALDRFHELEDQESMAFVTNGHRAVPVNPPQGELPTKTN